MTARLVLASASPARLRTLRNAGLRPEVVVSGVDETVDEPMAAAAYALHLAGEKAHAVAGRIAGDAYVLGCDSVLELDGEVHGKPASAADAGGRWRRMRGRSGVLHTGHCLVALPAGTVVQEVASTLVHFADVSDAEIDAYVATGEPLLVAGAFTLDGLGGAFVRGVEGDPHNVVGVSVPLLRSLFAAHGVAWTDLWHEPDRA